MKNKPENPFSFSNRKPSRKLTNVNEICEIWLDAHVSGGGESAHVCLDGSYSI